MTDRISVREVFFAPLLLTTAMVVGSLITAELAGMTTNALFVPYFGAAISITFFALLLTMFWWVVQLARSGADKPLPALMSSLRERAVYLLLPAVILPLFLVSFTVAKTAIPLLVGYGWDPFLARADRFVFGDDAWRITHHWLGNGPVGLLQWFYCVVWGIGLFFVMALVPLNAAPRFTARFYTAMMIIWLVGGFILAYVFSSAGPVFAHLVNSDPSDQFADLRTVLDSTLSPGGPIRGTQTYLASAVNTHVAIKGGGISAMPSMHVAAPSICVLAARRTPWLVPAILFWIVIFVGSAYFGYHYWLDGVASAALALPAWGLAKVIVPSSVHALGKLGAVPSVRESPAADASRS